MLGLLFTGIYLVFEPDAEDRKLGTCMAAWSAMALYLFLFQWLFLPKHMLIGLFAITALSSAGYIVGKTVSWLTRWEWTEGLYE